TGYVNGGKMLPAYDVDCAVRSLDQDGFNLGVVLKCVCQWLDVRLGWLLFVPGPDAGLQAISLRDAHIHSYPPSVVRYGGGLDSVIQRGGQAPDRWVRDGTVVQWHDGQRAVTPEAGTLAERDR